MLAGNNGIDNEIKAVDIIDVPVAAIRFLTGFLLSKTFYALKDKIGAPLQMLEDIKACGGAALITFSSERHISHSDERLSAMGIKESDILRLAREALNDPQTIGNPRDLTVEAYEEIYLHGI